MVVTAAVEPTTKMVATPLESSQPATASLTLPVTSMTSPSFLLLTSKPLVTTLAPIAVVVRESGLNNMTRPFEQMHVERTIRRRAIGGGRNLAGPADGLQLQLSVNASATNPDNNVAVSISVDEYNTLATTNDVSAMTDWGLDGLSLGSCGDGVYPFGVALYSGTYTIGNVSEATPLHIFPIVPCPMFVRLVTGYKFQPTSDLAVVLPGDTNATATQMSANIQASAVYGNAAPLSSSTALGPGIYTAAAGDEWGSVVLVHFTIGQAR